MSDDKPDYLQGNINGWQADAVNYVKPAEDAWAGEARWGIWHIPEAELKLLPADMQGMQAIELGCGTGYVSAWMQRRGALVVGIDPTPNQLATARRLRGEHGVDDEIELLEGYAERVPFPDASFDFAISEYGAALWSDPYLWIPEAARILKKGGLLVLLTNSPFTVMCMPEYDADGPTTDRLLRPYFGMHSTQWPDYPEQTEFHLRHGAWIDLFRANGLQVERLIELQAPADASTRYSWADPEWASKWPSEEVWVVKKCC